jgi:hypothetical protein
LFRKPKSKRRESNGGGLLSGNPVVVYSNINTIDVGQAVGVFIRTSDNPNIPNPIKDNIVNIFSDIDDHNGRRYIWGANFVVTSDAGGKVCIALELDANTTRVGVKPARTEIPDPFICGLHICTATNEVAKPCSCAIHVMGYWQDGIDLSDFYMTGIYFSQKLIRSDVEACIDMSWFNTGNGVGCTKGAIVLTGNGRYYSSLIHWYPDSGDWSYDSYIGVLTSSTNPAYPGQFAIVGRPYANSSYRRVDVYDRLFVSGRDILAELDAIKQRIGMS